VTVSGFSSSLQLSLFMAHYSAVTTTGSRYRLPPTTTYTDDDGNSYTAYGQASQAAVQFVIIPGFQLDFEPNPQKPGLVNQDDWERKHTTPDACGHMADLAQQQANKALAQAHGDASKALGAFDLGFPRIYAGKPMDGHSNAYDLFNNGPTGRTIGSYYLGETGFKVPYMDTGADMIQGHSNADQTHHFTAMFSAGINTTGISWLGATAHNFNDNAGDQRLTNAAYDLGSRLESNPNLLRKIGALIRSGICDPKTRGKHL
jgi:hypothetical protein